MHAAGPAPASPQSIKSRFLRFSAVMSVVLLLAFGALLGVQLHIQRGVAAVERDHLPQWRAALQLEIDIRALSLQVARIPLSLTHAEARTLRDRVDDGLALITDTLAASLPANDGSAARKALALALADLRATVELATGTTALRIELARQVTSDTSVIGAIAATRREERDFARRLDDIGLALASQASIIAFDNHKQLAAEYEHIARLRWLQSSLIVIAALLVGLLMLAQYRLIDRRLLRRIAQLRDSMTAGAVAPELLSAGRTRDELDAMMSELAGLLDRLSIQKHELERLAASDPLTGLANRRSLLDRFGFELARAQRYRRPLSVLMIDIDHFKRINDTWGHAAGDQVLRSIANLLQECTRHSDLLSRHGGEEFLMLLPETDAAAACELAELLRTRVETLALDLPQGSLAVTISVGCACLREGDSIDSLIERADLAMYAAKRKGRNRVEGDPTPSGIGS